MLDVFFCRRCAIVILVQLGVEGHHSGALDGAALTSAPMVAMCMWCLVSSESKTVVAQ
jgi:hypothetical protein